MYLGSLDPISNKVGWLSTFEVVDDTTGQDVDLTGASIVMMVRDPRRGFIVIQATTATGEITIIGKGLFQVNVAPVITQVLPADTYEVGCTITMNGVSYQLIIGTLPILDGIVTTL